MKHSSLTRNAFTLTELLLVIAIIGILSALGLTVLRGAEEDALKNRTNAQIERIYKVLNSKLEDSFFQVAPVRADPSSNPTLTDIKDIQSKARAEVLLVEYPWKQEHTNSAAFPRNQSGGVGGINMTDPNWIPVPQILSRYESYMNAPPYCSGSIPPWSPANEQAELLYAILALNYDQHGNPLIEVLRKSEIKDTDEDCRLEVVDAFGDPLEFQFVYEDDAGNTFEIDPTAPQLLQDHKFIINSRNTKFGLN